MKRISFTKLSHLYIIMQNFKRFTEIDCVIVYRSYVKLTYVV